MYDLYIDVKSYSEIGILPWYNHSFFYKYLEHEYPIPQYSSHVISHNNTLALTNE